MQHSSSTVNINSKHYLDSIEKNIVQLVKTLMIEHQITVDEAKAIARKSLQHKLNQMLTEDETKGISDLSTTTNNIIKASKEDAVCVGPIRIYARKVYELLKTMGFK